MQDDRLAELERLLTVPNLAIYRGLLAWAASEIAHLRKKLDAADKEIERTGERAYAQGDRDGFKAGVKEAGGMA